MKWWQKALIATAVLIVLDVGLGVVLYQRIHNTSANIKIESIRHDKMDELCGQILGAGLILIWAVAYFKEKKRQNP